MQGLVDGKKWYAQPRLRTRVFLADANPPRIDGVGTSKLGIEHAVTQPVEALLQRILGGRALDRIQALARHQPELRHLLLDGHASEQILKAVFDGQAGVLVGRIGRGRVRQGAAQEDRGNP